MKIITKFLKIIFSNHTISNIRYDLVCFKARLLTYIKYRGNKDLIPTKSKLHFGCGSIKVEGFLNVDLLASDLNLDLGAGYLPWKSSVFNCAVSQHFIEHLSLEDELIPLLQEIRRTLKEGGELWLSTPDIKKICQSYLNFLMKDLLAGRMQRFPNYNMGDKPSEYFINELFYQNGEHKNLFDYKLLYWILENCGFRNICHTTENDFQKCFPEFPRRNDEEQSIYIKAIAKQSKGLIGIPQ